MFNFFMLQYQLLHCYICINFEWLQKHTANAHHIPYEHFYWVYFEENNVIDNLLQ